uniref:Uncharacterized protein n=1 Tax=Anguilla anguilla TaxID=7936 RepID=A0A0E9QQG1_ANGAN
MRPDWPLARLIWALWLSRGVTGAGELTLCEEQRASGLLRWDDSLACHSRARAHVRKDPCSIFSSPPASPDLPVGPSALWEKGLVSLYLHQIKKGLTWALSHMCACHPDTK